MLYTEPPATATAGIAVNSQPVFQPVDKDPSFVLVIHTEPSTVAAAGEPFALQPVIDNGMSWTICVLPQQPPRSFASTYIL